MKFFNNPITVIIVLTKLISGLPVDTTNLNSSQWKNVTPVNLHQSLNPELKAVVPKQQLPNPKEHKNAGLVGGLLGGNKGTTLLEGDENQIGMLMKLLGDERNDGLLNNLLGGDSTSGKKDMLSGLLSTKDDSLVGGLLGSKDKGGLLGSVLGNGQKNRDETPGSLSAIPVAGPILQNLGLDNILGMLAM